MGIRIWHQSFTDLTKLPGYEKQLAEHARKVCLPDTTVDLHGVRPGSYPHGVTPIEATKLPWSNHVLATQIAFNAAIAQQQGYDAVAVSCFFDPGLREARSLVDIPVVSSAETTLLLGTALGGRFGLVGLQQEQNYALLELARSYGAQDRIAAVVPLDPPITEPELDAMFTDGDVAGRINPAAQAARAAGADLIIPAEGVLNTLMVKRELTDVAGLPVLDSFGLVLGYAEMLARLAATTGARVSHAGLYACPSESAVRHFAQVTADALTEGVRKLGGIR